MKKNLKHFFKNCQNTSGIASDAFQRRGLVRLLRWFALSASVVLLGACASVGSSAVEQTVTQRATARWKALIAQDFDSAYTYTTPAYRAVVNVQGFRARTAGAVTWLGSEVVEVKCPEPAKCTARVKVDFKPLLRGRPGDKFDAYFDETWLLEDGQWSIFEQL